MTTSSRVMLVLASVPIHVVILGLLQVLGALGVFLFGMKIMSEGVQRVAGKRLRLALAGLTTNRFSGIATGFFTTSLVQSSSATTVLVVSFVNAGLLTLVQSIGVIMGANLGTTVTAWIVAMVGKFDVSSVALPLIGIGLPFLFIGKNKGKSWGETLLGFGLVFFGLGLLKDSVPDLRELIKTDPGTAETIRNVVTWMGGRGMASTLLYLFGGIILTLMVQSSSAAMAITMTCALNGWLGDVGDPMLVFRNSAAIVLGENIGTTVTAWLAALGANVNARRAARAHFTFNVIGVLWMLIIFKPFTMMAWHLAGYLQDHFPSAAGDAHKSEIGFATAIFHSAFNFANICLLVAFIPQIAKLVEWWVRDKSPHASDVRLKYISQGLVDLGELNLAEAETATKRMNTITSQMFDGFVNVLNNPHEDLSSEVVRLKRMEDDCDLLLHDITSYLIQCSAREVGPGNADQITSMLRIVSEHEEASDRIYRLVKVVQRKYEKGHQFSDDRHRELSSLCTQVRAILDLCTNALSGVTAEMFENANRLEDRIDQLRKQHNKSAMRRMQSEGEVPTEMLYTEINNHLEAIGNHALNVIESAQRSKESKSYVRADDD
ncbi:Na/Pi cotransporter family protein [Luteolibacter pohnpeiensis]|uniref:Na/Pi cotransporter family protein n=1 Tax=Luteolibacter pohnpeiensis TaxID=454153 RepID=A0A934VWW8_9BACT|nr:Na/Pi cotransporter family protein [Luteolibacter pohnpeiensis]MBK1883238.1 Na/Pi cotransporter family protein [Luteolibacter pohnpeiensis]